ncbi:MAG: CapA family protein [Gammaproteobacteria bacterium]|nr:MAG: CapA family protein [Gammaproteobacteria bacterium]
MTKNKYVPIDLPRNLDGLIENLSEEVKEAIARITAERLAEGRWVAPETIDFDPNDTEFIAYWLHKTRAPLRKAMAGSGIEERLAPWKGTRFDLAPRGFEAKTEYHLSAAGDLMFAKHLEESKDHLYGAVEDLIFGADLAFANLESTLTSGEVKEMAVAEKGDTPYINITPGQYEALVKHKGSKFDIVQLANNHILDCGEEGISTTIDQLARDQIAFVGAYVSEADSRSVTSVQVGDLKIGWVAHTWSVNFKPAPEHKSWICDVTPFHIEQEPDTSRIEEQIRQARAEGCDLVILALHWGLEHEFYPHPDQLAWARRFAEAGADAIIGHHPHVIQFTEIYRPERNPGQAVPILYSLGNLTPAYCAPATVLSLVANLRIAKGRVNGDTKTLITGLELTPVAFMGEKQSNCEFAAIVPLEQLNRCPLDADTRAFVNELAEIADFVLGESWRDPGK